MINGWWMIMFQLSNFKKKCNPDRDGVAFSLFYYFILDKLCHWRASIVVPLWQWEQRCSWLIIYHASIIILVWEHREGCLNPSPRFRLVNANDFFSCVYRLFSQCLCWDSILCRSGVDYVPPLPQQKKSIIPIYVTLFINWH